MFGENIVSDLRAIDADAGQVYVGQRNRRRCWMGHRCRSAVTARCLDGGVGWLATARIVTVAQFRPGVAEHLLVGMLSVLVGMFN